jgi:signal transduction histidine kinase
MADRRRFEAEPEAFEADRSEVRSAIIRFLLMGAAALLVVAVPVSFWILAEAKQHALANARTATQQLADTVMGPHVTDQLAAQQPDPATIRMLDERLAPWVHRGTIMRIKVWDSTGRIVYSDVKTLIGQRFPLGRWPLAVLASGEGRATLETQSQHDHEFESNFGELVEVYVRENGIDRRPLLFEAYYGASRVRAEQAQVLGDMSPAILMALAVLQFAQLVPAIALARRIQATQASRRRLLQHSIDASALERRRIARDLHDEVIQDLAGLSYALEAEEMRAAPSHRHLFTQARSILQDNVRTLRAMTRELYPADLEELGLSAALDRLADPLRQAGIEVIVRGDGVGPLPRDAAAMLYRAGREALLNIVKHAGAGRVSLTLDEEDNHTVLTILDDGRGFETASGAPEGHLGLRILKDTIEEAGGSLEVVSRPGEGTRVEVRLASPARVS